MSTKRAYSDCDPSSSAPKRLKDDEKENQAPTTSNDDFSSIVARIETLGELHPENKQYYIYEKSVPRIISKTARSWALKYRRVMEHVDPDSYKMYIHDDFVCYGELEVIENCLLDMEKDLFKEKKITFPRAIHAFRRWEALILLLHYAHSYLAIDDGERLKHFLRLIGACTVTILRNLLPKSILETNDRDEEISSADLQQLTKISQRLVNWKDVLQQALVVSGRESPSAYLNVLQAVYCNWLWWMEKSPIDATVRDVVHQGREMARKRFNESFDFLKEFAHYRQTYPDLGGDAHDLRRWPRGRRLLFSSENDDSNSNPLSNFWFRM